MIPVAQTVIGTADGPPKGNCLAACLASVLEIPLDKAPHFMGCDDWRPRTVAAIADLGYLAAFWAGGDWLRTFVDDFGGYWIAAVPSLNVPPRDDTPRLHSVVMHGWTVAWDPAQHGNVRTNVDPGEVFDGLFLIPHDPARRGGA